MNFVRKLISKGTHRQKTTQQDSPGKGEELKTRPLMLALEPRLLYDAAGLVSVADVAASADGLPADAGGDAGEHDLSALADLAPPATGEEAHGSPPTESNPDGDEAAGLAPADAAADSQVLVFVDSNIVDADTLLQGLDSNASVIFLDSDGDGVSQITEALAQYQDLDAVYILSHGSEGEAVLGTAGLSLSTLETYSDQLIAWGDALSENGDILFYGCSIGSGSDGEALISKIADLTGADVAASDDPTGADSLGGDWELEVESGDIEADAVLSREAQDAYSGLLAVPAAPSTPDLDAGSDSGSSNSDNITNDTTPTFSGTAEAGSTVTLYEGATSLGTATADGSGNWSITSSTLAEGTYDITATATNGDGTSAASSALTVTIDTTAPGVQQTLDLRTSSDTGISDTDNIVNKTTGLAFDGRSSEAGILNFYRNGTHLGGAPVSGAIFGISVLELVEGTNDLTVKLADLAGNLGPESAALTVTVDTTAPATVPGTPDLTAASDTGSSTTDNITNDTTPTFEGTGAVAGEPVAVYAGDTLLGTTTADGSGNWSFTPSSTLAEGTYSITARTMDTAGNTSADSSALSITIDTTAPSAPSTPDLVAASDSGISDSDDLTNDTTPTLEGTAEANAQVSLYDGGNLLGTTTADSSGNWSYTQTSALIDGVHNITARVTDTAGNQAASSALTLTVDTSANYAVPSIPNLAAASDSGISDNITNDSTPTYEGTALAGLRVAVYADNVLLGTGIADSSGNWSVTSTTALADGTYAVTARIMDDAGNTSAASYSTSITVDTSAPSAPSAPDLDASSDTGRSQSDNITNDTTPTFTGAAEAGSTVSVYDGVTLLGTTRADGSGAWSFTPASALAEGDHTITVTATDAAGNTSAASDGLTLTIDTTGPVTSALDLVSAYDSGRSQSDNITNASFILRTNFLEEAGYQLYTDGVSQSSTMVYVSPAPFTWIPSRPGDGTHTYTFSLTDIAGNTTTSDPLAITFDTAAPATPPAPDLSAASDTGSSDADNLTSNTTPTLTGTAEAGSTVSVYDGSILVGTTTADGSGNWSFTPSSALAGGGHTITVTATDAAGNTSAASAGLALTIDTTAPGAPSTPDLAAASDSGSSDSDDITNDTKPTLTGTAEAGSTVSVYDGSTLVGTTTANGSGAWTFTPSSALAEGAHTITVTATDAAGNTSAASPGLGLTIDTTAPAAPSSPDLVASSDSGSSDTDNLTNDTTPTLTGTAEAGSTVSVYDGSILVGTTTADGSGNWSFTPSSALAGGGHTITVTATDAAGNTSSASTGLTVTIDTSAPGAPGTPDLAAGSDSGSSDTDNLTNDTTPTLSGTAEANATVTVYDGSTILGTTTADGSGAWTYTPSSALAEGAHTITVTATDAAGNTSAASAGLTITIDTTAPAVTDGNISISGATGNGGAFKVGDTVTASWDNSGSGDNNADVASVTMDFSEFGGPSAVTATLSGGIWQASFAIVEDGGGVIEATNRNVSVTATDTAGNVRTVQDGANATVDNNTPETVTGTLAVDEQVPDDTLVGTVSSIGADTYSLVDDAGGRFTIDAATGELRVGNGQALDFEALESHTIVVRAEDAAGNAVETSLVVAVNDVFDDPAQNPSPSTGTGTGSPGGGPAGGPAGPAGPDAPGNSPWAPPGSLPGPLNAGEGPGLTPGPAEGFESAGEGQGIPNVTLASAETLEFVIPEDAFSRDIPAADFTYEVTLADGSPLPEWISFDPDTQVFTVSPGGQFEGEVTVVVVARDASGAEIRIPFTIRVSPEASGQAAVPGQIQDTGIGGAPAGDLSEAPDWEYSGGDTILAALVAGVIPAAGFTAPVQGPGTGLSARIGEAAGRFDRGLRELLARVG